MVVLAELLKEIVENTALCAYARMFSQTLNPTIVFLGLILVLTHM